MNKQNELTLKEKVRDMAPLIIVFTTILLIYFGFRPMKNTFNVVWHDIHPGDIIAVQGAIRYGIYNSHVITSTIWVGGYALEEGSDKVEVISISIFRGKALCLVHNKEVGGMGTRPNNGQKIVIPIYMLSTWKDGRHCWNP